MRYVMLFSLLCFTLWCHAAIFMQTDKFGNITYSDTPQTNSKKIELPAVNSTTSNVQTAPVTTTTVSTSTSTINPGITNAYNEFSIISPKDQDTIQNQPVIPVEIGLKPDLRQGDKIQLLVDGKLTGNAYSSKHLQLGLVERGTHQLSAIIINANQQVIQQTNAITVYIHRANQNSSPAFKQNSENSSISNRFIQQVKNILHLII